MKEKRFNTILRPKYWHERSLKEKVLFWVDTTTPQFVEWFPYEDATYEETLLHGKAPFSLDLAKSRPTEEELRKLFS